MLRSASVMGLCGGGESFRSGPPEMLGLGESQDDGEAELRV